MSDPAAFDSFDEMWKAVCKRYPEFAEDDHIVKQRARGLRRLLEQAWTEAHKKGFANGLAFAAMAAAKKKSDPNSAEALYERMFGRKFGS